MPELSYSSNPNLLHLQTLDNVALHNSQQLPIKPFDGCLCPNCVDTYIWPTFSVASGAPIIDPLFFFFWFFTHFGSPGWPTYVYNGSNTVSVIVENSLQQQICLSDLIVHIRTERGSSPSADLTKPQF